MSFESTVAGVAERQIDAIAKEERERRTAFECRAEFNFSVSRSPVYTKSVNRMFIGSCVQIAYKYVK